MTAQSDCIKLHHLIFKFVRTQRFVGLNFNIPSAEITAGLSHTEQSVLFVLNSLPEINIRDLAKHAGIERSWISRVVASLEEKKLLVIKEDLSDKRNKKISLNKLGKETLPASEKIVAKLFEELLKKLTKEEQKKFLKYLENFANGIGASKFQKHESGSDVAYQLGRISAKIGMYNDNVFDSNLSVNQLQTLLILELNKNTNLTLKKIDELLPIDLSSVSRIVQKFVKEGLVNKVKSETDKRSVHIELTNKGLDFLNTYYEEVVDLFSNSLKTFSKEEKEGFFTIYEKVGGDSSGLNIEMKSILQEINEEEKIKFIEKNLKTTKTNKTFGFYSKEKLKAIVSLEKNKEKIISIKIQNADLEKKDLLKILNDFL